MAIPARKPSVIPTELQERCQWVTWRYAKAPGKTKAQKQPYNAQTGRACDAYDPANWSSYHQALAALQSGRYDGVGYVFSPDDPYTGVDLDACRNQQGHIAPWACGIIDRLSSYTEVSPSGTGVHILIRAQLAQAVRHNHIEIYDRRRYFTVSGSHVVGTPITIQDRQVAIQHLITQIRPTEETPAAPHQDTTPSDYNDHEILSHLSHGRNAGKFLSLWNGDLSGYHVPSQFKNGGEDYDHSGADLALCALIARWTRDAAQIDRLFRQSSLYRAEKWDRTHYSTGETYGEHTIAKAITTAFNPPPPRQTTIITPLNPTQRRRRHETKVERTELLHAAAATIRQRTEDHLASASATIQIQATPPGCGKTHTTAEIGIPQTQGGRNIAWVSQRHTMHQSVPALALYREILPCDGPDMCPDWQLHQQLGAKGYNTLALHMNHPLPCKYLMQYRAGGSAFYQLAHLRTPYVATHEAIVIDELDLPSMLPQREITMSQIKSAAYSETTDSTPDLLLRALECVLTDAAQQKTLLTGKTLFDALNTKCHGHLTDWLGTLDQDAEYRNTRPWFPVDPTDPTASEQITRLHPVTLPHIVVSLLHELVRWQSGADWNSCLRIDWSTHEHGMAFYITERVEIGTSDGKRPPVTILDATPDAQLYQQLFGPDLCIERTEVIPPPNTQHIHVPIRYGKTTLTAQNRRDLDRAIAQCKHLLKQQDPTGDKTRMGYVGLVTFQQSEAAIGEALGIPEHRRLHFWGARGSNALEDCEILLIVGTPALNPSELHRLACALWQDDTTPIDPGSTKRGRGQHHYTDARMQYLNDYLIRAELTQAAHRNRPLRHDGRLIISLCQSAIDYLPEPHIVTEFPALTCDGDDARAQRQTEAEQRMSVAYATSGETITVAQLAKAAHVRVAIAGEWLKRHRGARPRRHTPPVFISQPANRAITSTSGNALGSISRADTNTGGGNASAPMSRPPALPPDNHLILDPRLDPADPMTEFYQGYRTRKLTWLAEHQQKLRAQGRL